MSCDILMPKYVITALLTYFIQYKELAWGGGNYVEKNSSFMFTLTCRIPRTMLCPILD